MTAHHHEDDTAFIKAKRGLGHQWRRSLASGKKHVVSLTYTTVMTGMLAAAAAVTNHYEQTDKTNGGSKGPTWQQFNAVKDQVADLKTEVACLQQRLDDWQTTQPKQGHR